MRRRTVVLAAAAALAIAGPAPAFERSCGERGPSTQRVAVTFVRKAAFLWFGKECRIDVHPGKKEACPGDTVAWTVVNTCAETGNAFTNVEMTGLTVMDSCAKPKIPALAPGAADEIVCTLKTGLPRGDHKYTVRTDQRELDPELEIVR